MTFEELEAIVQTVKYKPGFNLACCQPTDDPYVAVKLIFTLIVPDVRNPEHIVGVYRIHTIGHDELAYLPMDALLFWIDSYIRDIEMHEVDEWLTVGGKRIKEPVHG